MRVSYRASFGRDLRRLSDIHLRRRVARTITELEAAESITEVPNLIRLRSASGRHYRIRIGDYRLGITLEDDTAVLVRLAHRREFYRRFP